LAAGTHAATASAVDVAGNTSGVSTAVSFVVGAGQAPSAPVITAPAASSTSGDAKPTISGVAEPGSSVTVFIDTVSVCTTTTDAQGHFSCASGTALADGTHTATANATVGGVTSALSSPVSFSVDTQAPNAPTIVVPAASAMTDATPSFSGTAEAGSTVAISVDGTVACTTTATSQGAYACVATTPLSAGAHVANATATDAAGNVSTESADTQFTVVIGAAPGTPVVLLPTPGATTNDNTPSVSGLGTPGSTISVSIDGMVVCTAVVNAQGQWTCTVATSIGDGEHEVTATASNGNGTSPSSSGTDFIVDTAPPMVPTISGPVSGATTSPSPAINGAAEPNTTVTVEVDGVVVCLVTSSVSGQWSCVVGTSLADGAHQVTASATDGAGNTSAESPPRDFVVSRGSSPSTPTLTTPVNGSRTRDTTPTFSGMAEPGSTVSVRVDGALVCSATASAQGVYSCDATAALADGTHSATASASNSRGSSADSPATSFTLDSTAPTTPVVTTPAQGGTGVSSTPVFSGTAEVGSVVEVTVDGTVVCAATTNAQGEWSCTITTPLSNGTHRVTATATDATGNVSPTSADRTFSVTTGGGVIAPVIASPANGATVAGPNVTISGTTVAGASIRVTDASGADVCVATGNSSGVWSCQATLPAGVYAVKATATVGGNTSLASNVVTFTVTVIDLIKGQRLAGGGCGCGSSADAPLAMLALAMLFVFSRRRRSMPCPATR